MTHLLAFITGSIAATVALFAVAHVTARRPPRERVVPIQAETPVRVWYESGGRMTRHDLDDGETIGIVTPGDARDVTIIAAHPRHLYVAEAFAPQYEG